jgi:hypothetical protein
MVPVIPAIGGIGLVEPLLVTATLVLDEVGALLGTVVPDAVPDDAAGLFVGGSEFVDPPLHAASPMPTTTKTRTDRMVLRTVVISKRKK